MVSKMHCQVCGFLMMYEMQDGQVSYICVNQEHPPIGKTTLYSNIHMSDEMAKELKQNADVVWEYIMRP